MRILAVNPNSTRSMTVLVEECARAVAGPGVLVDAVHPSGSPPAIQNAVDEVLAAPGVVAAVQDGVAGGYDGFVVACFGDPGLDAAREVAAGRPVVGIAEAALRTASYLGRTFSVVTTVSSVLASTRALVHHYGVAERCAGVHACELPVLALEEPGALDRVALAAGEALAVDGSDVLVLGCAGMAPMVGDLTARLGVPVVDGVAAATATVEALLRTGLGAPARAGALVE